jgi:iron(III) transport system substrate-binding protein
MKRFHKISIALTSVLFAGLLTACGSGASDGKQQGASPSPSATPTATVKPASTEVNVYTARHYEVDDTLYSNFTKSTGIKVNVVKGTAEELVERMKREGASSPADLFITVDGGVLNNAKLSGVLQPIQSSVITENVPAQYRDKENQWIGLSSRARIIAYSKERVKPEQLSTYEDLATDKWKGKVLVRSSTSLYNQSLLASLIELGGEAKAEQWAKGIATNLGRAPEGGDRDQAKAILAGQGDVAIMNTYYVGQLLNSKDAEEVKVGKQIGVFFPNQQTTGTHLNISGAGLAKNSKNKDAAIKLIEYLTGTEAQGIFSKVNFEFPVNPKAELPELLKSWGEFKKQQLDFSKLGEHNKKAVEILNKVGWK